MACLGLSMPLLTTSCATGVARVDSHELKSTMGLDPVDVAEIAAEMSESMLSANVLRSKGADGRSIVVISNFRNNTSLYDFDPNVIYRRVTTTLNRSGVAYAYVKGREDSYTSDRRAYNNQEADIEGFLSGSEAGERKRDALSPRPQYSITLELIEQASYVGRRTQKSYQIHMTLNRIGRGLAIWEDIRDINKMRKTRLIGF